MHPIIDFSKQQTPDIVKIQQILLVAAVAVTTWFAAANSNRAQAKYENDVTEYEQLLAGDSLPVQARVEHAHQQVMTLNLPVQGNQFLAAKAQEKAESDAKSSMLDGLLATAYKYMGVRYRSGMSGPNGFDCSGFTRFVYRQHDIQLTHSSRAQYNEGERINDIAQLQKGDLVFFGGSRGGAQSIGHVGIVTEVDPATRSFKFIHASTSSGIKVDSSRDPYYTRRYVGACRVIQ